MRSFRPKLYPRRFIEIQIRFAEQLTTVTGEPFSHLLATETVFRQLLGVPIHEDGRVDSAWDRFGADITAAPDRVQWAYDYYLANADVSPATDEPRFGCFSYDSYFHPAIRLHFSNPGNVNVLDKASVRIRRNELRVMFQHIILNCPDAECVRGGSWLYNIEAYRRLFPPSYIASAVPIGYQTAFFSLWGQFLQSGIEVREDAAERFLHSLAPQTCRMGCLSCFPFQVLQPECPIETFYRFLQIGT